MKSYKTNESHESYRFTRKSQRPSQHGTNYIHSLIIPWVSLLLVLRSLVITYNLALITEENVL